MLQRLTAYAKLMRLDRPWPLLLIVLPTCWGLFLGPHRPSVAEVGIFMIGALLTRSAGCVINDYFDRNIDGRVTRTQTRPLAVGKVKPAEAVLLFCLLMLLALLLLLLLQPKVIVLGGVAFLLALFYPLAKRFTYFPQFILGIAFNFGLLMAALQVNGTISAQACAYYAVAVLWTIHYDTLYALADYQDDLKIGVKSIPTFFKERVYAFLRMTSMLCVLSMSLIWVATGLTHFRILLLVLLLMFFMQQYRRLLAKREAIGLQLFKQHGWVGLLILLGILYR